LARLRDTLDGAAAARLDPLRHRRGV